MYLLGGIQSGFRSTLLHYILISTSKQIFSSLGTRFPSLFADREVLKGVKMEIKKTIKLNVIKQKNNILCNDLATLQLIIGTKGVAGNLDYYGIKKDSKNRYIVPIEKIKERISALEDRKSKIEGYIEIMKQVI